MSKISLTIAVDRYDHVEDLATGKVPVEGVDVNFLALPTLEIFHRFTHRQEFDVSEMSFGRYISQFSQGNSSIVALPVFLSRMFRQAAIFVLADGPITRQEDLLGKRIGVPEWTQTATIYLRGWLQHFVGADLKKIGWFSAGPRGPNPYGEQVAIKLPEGMQLTRVADRGLGDLLLDGDIDVIFSASPPPQFGKDSRIVRLFPQFQQVEELYYQATGIFPIMHILCVRRDVAERHPWLPMNLLRAFEESKRKSLERLRFSGMSRYPLPWCNAYVNKAKSFFGEDFWPYGVSANKKTLEAFVQYSNEQGVCHRKVGVEELFAVGAREVSTFFD